MCWLVNSEEVQGKVSAPWNRKLPDLINPGSLPDTTGKAEIWFLWPHFKASLAVRSAVIQGLTAETMWQESCFCQIIAFSPIMIIFCPQKSMGNAITIHGISLSVGLSSSVSLTVYSRLSATVGSPHSYKTNSRFQNGQYRQWVQDGQTALAQFLLALAQEEINLVNFLPGQFNEWALMNYVGDS